MPWFRVDDQIVGNKKFARIPRADRMAATGLWTTLGSWCARELTGGLVEAHMVTEVGGTTKQAAALVKAGLWEEVESGYQYVNWAEYQPTREQVEADREAAKIRQQRAREKARQQRNGTVSHGVTNGVTTPAVTVPPARPVPVLPTEVLVGEPTPRKRGQRLPEDWRPSEDVWARVAKERPDLDLEYEHENFQLHWAGAGGPSSSKLDWDKAWQVWMRKQAPTPKRNLKAVNSGEDWFLR